jgi:hypothetical protein
MNLLAARALLRTARGLTYRQHASALRKSKRFFFEKKKQKTFASAGVGKYRADAI